MSISLGKGGAERSCAMLTQMLSKTGHEVHLVILNNIIDYPYRGKLLNLGLLKDTNDSIWKRVKRFSILRKYLKHNNFDFIIDHRSKNNYYRELFYDRYVYAQQRRIYVTHSSNKEQYLTQFPKRFAHICNKNFSNVTVSEYIKDTLKHTGIQQLSCIHNAFNETWSEVKGLLPKELDTKKYILSYGRIVDHIKDFRFLIACFEASQLWEQEIALVIMGDGPDKEELKQFAKQSRAAQHIIFLPFVPEPFSIIKKAIFVTLTSKYEGFPMVLVEALAMGTPVISLDIISGPNEIIDHQHNGLLIQQRSIPLFSSAMKRMVSEKDLLQNCRANAQASVAKFSMTEIAKKWNQLFSHEGSHHSRS